MKIYQVDNSNYLTILPILQVSEEVKTEILNAVNAGKNVIIPEANIQLNDWQGIGYIVTDPNTGAGAYMISGGLSGGASTSEVSIADIIMKALLVAFGAFALAEIMHTFEILAKALIPAAASFTGLVVFPVILMALIVIAIAAYLVITYIIFPSQSINRIPRRGVSYARLG